MKKVFSPHGGVFGHDTTYIRRMTLEQYRVELRAEAAEQEGQPSSPSQSRSASRHEAEKRTHTGLSSRNPNVVFSSKYPVYNRLGRELCVAHQSQDMMVQQELRRLEEERQGGLDGRRSGVRLSAELPLGSDGTATTRPCSVAETQPPSLADDDDREYEFSTMSHRLVRASHVDEGDSAMDVTVSVTSHYPSVSASRTSSRPVSARPSEFSIFRESAAPVAAAGAAVAARKAYSSVPFRTIPEEDKILVHRAAGVERGQRATSMPFSPGSALRSGGDRVGSTLQQDRGWRLVGVEKRPRSRSAGDRLSRVRFVSEEDGDDMGGGGGGVSPYGLDRGTPRAVLPPRPPTPPPLPLSEPTPTPQHDTTHEEATRWTTLARGSAGVRATKQLFRPTAHSVNTSRTTTTLSYSQPISSNVYGLTAPAILASKVQTAVEQNVLACTAAMPQHYTQGFAAEESEVAHRQHTPELCCGSVVQLGDRWFRLVHFYVVAEVYEAVCVEAPATAACEAAESSAFETPTEESRIAGNAVQTPAVKGGDDSAQKKTSADPPQQFFLYRWRSAEATRCLDEARRAALGFSLCGPHVHVTGFNYADGGGVTLVAVPVGHHAVPVSALPLSLRSYTTLLRMVLKTLSAMVARRTIHGNLEALGELFLLWPTEASSAPDKGEEGDAAETKPREPCVLLFHWERWVDFGMFMDRNAGRTVPLDLEDSSAQPLVSYGKDLLTGLQLFLEHPLAAQLTSEQYILLQKLVVLAAEPTSVANHLIQLKNLMLTLPIDTTALEKSVRGAVVQHMDA